MSRQETPATPTNSQRMLKIHILGTLAITL